ncbi:tetratricopeptide repeat protein [candidate division KSB1 bacterium]|nr:tetratricopeptide repeat protein [candidate division KSB1 bacterium]
MKELYKFLRTLRVLAIVLAFVLPTIAGAQSEIPLTTKSAEARKIFLEARQQFENIRFDEARDLFAKAIAKDPSFALAHLYRSFTGTSAMDFQKHLKNAVALAPKASEGERLMIEAVQANTENNPVKAVTLAEQLVQKFPNDKRAHFYLGQYYYGRDEDDRAIAELNKATEIDKNYAPAYNLLGYAHREQGDYAKAEEAFKNYIRLLPNEANPYDSLADLYTKMGRYEEAITNYKKAVELNPKFAFSQGKIGDNLVFMGKFEEGRAAYRKAMEMETTPSGKLTHTAAIARSFIYEGKPQQALTESEKILQMAAQDGLPEWQAGTHSTNCDIYIETGNFDKAEQSLAECRKVMTASQLSTAIKENFAKAALFDEAVIAAKRKDFTKATAKADEYRAKIEAGKDPKEMENHHALLGRIYFEKGEYAKAVEHLKQANQENPYTLFLLAFATSETGDMAKSAELYKKAANWNENSLNYAFIRSKAMTALEAN